MAGLDPNRALVFGLQARGDKLVSRDFLRRQMPWEINVTMEEQRLEVEELRDSLLQAVMATAQAIPTLAVQGQDPSKFINAIALAIKARQNGEQIESVLADAFAPQQESPAVAAPGAEQSPAQSPGGALSPTQAPAPQGQPSSLQNLLAGLSSSGSPALSASVSRRSPA